MRREGKTKVLSLDRDRERKRERLDRDSGVVQPVKEKEKEEVVVVSAPLYLPPKDETDSPIATPTKTTAMKPRF